MTGRIELYADDELDIEARRTDDESASVVLSIKTGTGERVDIVCGRYYEDADRLAGELERAAKEARGIVDDWRDVPDETDGFVFEDRGSYVVQLEGLHWNGSKLVRVSRFPSREWQTFPTREIAEYELARAMVESGIFPNCWYQDERGWSDDISQTIRDYHDEGGDKMRPLEGVEYLETGGDVMVDGWRAYVLRDYGKLGVVYTLSGDDQERWTDDRSSLVRIEEEDEDA